MSALLGWAPWIIALTVMGNGIYRGIRREIFTTRVETRAFDDGLAFGRDEGWSDGFDFARGADLDHLRRGEVLRMTPGGPAWCRRPDGSRPPAGAHLSSDDDDSPDPLTMLAAAEVPSILAAINEEPRLPTAAERAAMLAELADSVAGPPESATCCEHPGTGICMCDCHHNEAPVPTSPPVGAGLESPGPDGAGTPSPQVGELAALPVTRAGSALPVLAAKPDSPGPGDLISTLPDDEFRQLIAWDCARTRREFAKLKELVSEPCKLTAWRMA